MIYWKNVHILLVHQKSRLQTSTHNIVFYFLKKYTIKQNKTKQKNYQQGKQYQKINKSEFRIIRF